MASPPLIAARDARRLLLGAQGLLDDPRRRATPAAVRSLIERMGFVQIDTINVVERAHHLTLHSRLDDYRPHLLARLLERDRSLFEHWTHDAAVIPTPWFPHWRPRFERYRRRDPQHSWWRVRMGPNPGRVIAAVLRRVEAEGPLMSRDFERPQADTTGVTDKWWQWKPDKAALEYLWRCGELAVARRINFHKVYDLTSRVLPHVHGADPPAAHEHVDWACRSALERLGTATPRELAAFWAAIDLPVARRWCAAAHRRGQIVPVTVQNHRDGGPPLAAFAFPDWPQRLRSLPDPPATMRILSPFDPVLRDRARALRLFGFEYTLEVFVPPPKRRYGYWVMPLLEADRLVGRADIKLHRDRAQLEVKGLWWEPGIRPTARRRAGLARALERLCGLVGAADFSAPPRLLPSR